MKQKVQKPMETQQLQGERTTTRETHVDYYI